MIAATTTTKKAPPAPARTVVLAVPAGLDFGKLLAQAKEDARPAAGVFGGVAAQGLWDRVRRADEKASKAAAAARAAEVEAQQLAEAAAVEAAASLAGFAVVLTAAEERLDQAQLAASVALDAANAARDEFGQDVRAGGELEASLRALAVAEARVFHAEHQAVVLRERGSRLASIAGGKE